MGTTRECPHHDPLALKVPHGARAFFSWSGGKDSMLRAAPGAGGRLAGRCAAGDVRRRRHALALPRHAAGADAGAGRLAGHPAGRGPRRLGRLRGRLHRPGCAPSRRTASPTACSATSTCSPHRDWEERVCAAAGLQAVLPLWQQPRRALVDELLALGYRARVVCVDARYLDASYCGLRVRCRLRRRPARGRRRLRRERRVPQLRLRRPALRPAGRPPGGGPARHPQHLAPRPGHHVVAELA